jgi:hypothetical protein
MILPSDCCTNTQTSNTASKFIVDWDPPISLCNKWEVALIEYSFSHNFVMNKSLDLHYYTNEKRISERFKFTLKEGVFIYKKISNFTSGMITITVLKDSRIEITSSVKNISLTFFNKTASLMFGFQQYDVQSNDGKITSDVGWSSFNANSIVNITLEDDNKILKRNILMFDNFIAAKTHQELETYFEHYCEQLFDVFKINHNGKVVIQVNKNIVNLVMDEELRQILGLEDFKIFKGGHDYVGKNKVSLTASIRSVNIITNITEPILVGGRKLPLLRTIWLDDCANSVCHGIIDTPMYINVSLSRINNIEVQLTDKFGSLLPCVSDSSSTITLHFRKQDD